MKVIAAEEANARRVEVYAARQRYEELLDAYERDVYRRDDRFASIALADHLEPSGREMRDSEEEFRRGYLHGVREALSHMWTFVRERRIAFESAYDALWDWHDHELIRWHQAARNEGDINMTPPPTPVYRQRGKRP